MDIKVEPLSPGTFTVDLSENQSRNNSEDKSRLAGSVMHFNPQMPEYMPAHTTDNSYKYQSTSMPVFPGMSYPSSYPYVPIRPAPIQNSKASAQFTSTSQDSVALNHSGSMSCEPYDAAEEAAFEEKVPRNSTGIVGKRSHLPKRYKCAMCAYKTRYKSDLNRHVRKHAIATFNCDICNMPFKTVGNVEFHKRKEHSELLTMPAVPSKEAVKYACKMCPYGTQYSSDLTRHVRKHYVAKLHCSVCNKTVHGHQQALLTISKLCMVYRTRVQNWVTAPQSRWREI